MCGDQNCTGTDVVLLSGRALRWKTVKKVNPDPVKDVMEKAVPDLSDKYQVL